MEPDLNAIDTGRSLLRRLFGGGGVPLARPTEAAVVAFASGKGGTGKSFLTTNVAIGLHAAGRRVVVVDCDFGLANAHLLFGVNPRLSMLHLLDGAVSAAEALTPTPFGPSLIAGGSGIASLAELGTRHMQALAKALHWLAGCHDYVLLDCAAGLAPQSMITVLAAEQVVVVTNPEIAALTDAYALIKCLARQPGRPDLGLVVNRTAAGLGRATFDRLADVSRRFAGCDIHYLGAVPEDPAVSHRRLGQAPRMTSAPTCPTSEAIHSILQNVEAQAHLHRTTATRGVEGRMLAQIRRW